jgi:hypothetical protein
LHELKLRLNEEQTAHLQTALLQWVISVGVGADRKLTHLRPLCRFKTDPGVFLLCLNFGQRTNKVITMEMLGRIRRMHLRAKVDELHLTPLELIDRIAALVPPPRTHRHRYFGVLAPISPHISQARGPPLWVDGSDAQTDEGVHIEPDWDLAAQPAPDFEVDQRVNW